MIFSFEIQYSLFDILRFKRVAPTPEMVELLLTGIF